MSGNSQQTGGSINPQRENAKQECDECPVQDRGLAPLFSKTTLLAFSRILAGCYSMFPRRSILISFTEPEV
jgi:hypothetical protein